MDKLNILMSLAKVEQEKIFIKKTIDKIQRTYNNNFIQLTNFLDPGQIYLTQCIANSLSIVDVYFDGGYGGAERRRTILVPIGYPKKEMDAHISVLKLTPSKFSKTLGHRDYLGSLIGLGVKVETIGDILLTNENTAFALVISEVKDYIFEELNKVGKEHINIEEVSKSILNSIKLCENFSEKTVSIPSPRLDSIISEVFDISRSVATNLVRQKKTKVNFRLEEKPHSHINKDDLISVRGYGRCKILEVLGETRKGRKMIKVRVY